MYKLFVDIYIPTLYRPGNIDRLLDSFYEHCPINCNIWFMCAKDDAETIALLKKRKMSFWLDGEDTRFVKRIQYMYEHTAAPWFLTGADDITFHPGWLDAAKPFMDKYSVISFDDMCNPNLPGTNFLIKRDYIVEQSGVMDASNTVFHQGYFHNYCDNELVMVAMGRGEFVKCSGKIEHHHPMKKDWNGWDNTYQIAKDHWDQDAKLFTERSSVWSA